MRRVTLALLLLSLGCSDGSKAKPEAGPRPAITTQVLDTFDAAVEPLRVAFDVPGVAVAIVKNGEIVFARGYGLRDIESGDPVTPDTVFRIGSLTKSFTSALVAALVDDGALGFDTRAKDIDATFVLPTTELTDDVTVHELLGMGTGLGEPNGFWWDYPTATSLLHSFRNVDVEGPEGTYFYNNEAYASGAYLALEAAKPPDELTQAYARLVRERLLDPLGMSPASVTDDPSTLGADVAASYTLSLVAGPGAPERIGFSPLASVAPAGAIATSVTSLARYAAMQLAHGVGPDGNRLVSVANLDATHAPQTPQALPDEPWATDYAMGWSVGNESGVPVLWHDGAVDGYTATLRLLPDDDWGLVVLTNGWSGQNLCLALEEKLMDLVYGASALGPQHYVDEYANVRSQLVTLEGLLAEEDPIDADAVAPFLGDYGHEVSLELDAASDELFVVEPGSRNRVVRADRLSRKPGVYLIASGPDGGNELTLDLNMADGKPELTVVDPVSHQALLVLEEQ
jgi:CubicO group peptidase (beta-lactamase class C family)